MLPLSEADEAVHDVYVALVRESEVRSAQQLPLTKEDVDDAELRARTAKCMYPGAGEETVAALDRMVAALRTSYVMADE